MRRRLAILRILKWTGALLSASMLLFAAASLNWWYLFVYHGGSWSAIIECGAIEAFWSDVPNSSQGEWLAFTSAYEYDTWQESVDRFTFSPSINLNCPGWIVVPLWIPFLLFAIPTALLWRLDRRRPLPGHCPHCQYNLTANTSGRCPECGQPVLKSPISNLKS